MENKFRYALLDSIRGLVLISMILYHACWNLVWLFGKTWSWYSGTGAYIWQQSICWTFILLSGFCWPLGKKPLKRGLTVFGGGILVSLVTFAAMPSGRIMFGILTLIGSCMLFMIPLERILKRAQPAVGFAFSFVLFLLTRNVNTGWLGFEDWNLAKIPEALYRGWLASYLGFTESGFFSADYFSVFPWVFLFITGYFLFRLCTAQNDRAFLNKYFIKGIRPLAFLGRNSLLIYLLHQPLVYGIFLIMRRVHLL